MSCVGYKQCWLFGVLILILASSSPSISGTGEIGEEYPPMPPIGLKHYQYQCGK